MFANFCRGIEISLAKCRAPAALPIFYKGDLESERFKDFDRSDSNVRFVIAHKRVIPKDDMTPGGDTALL